MPNPSYSTATHLRGALYAYLAPRMAINAQIPDLGPIVQNVTRKNFSAMRNHVAARVCVAMRGKLAMDADISDLLDLLDALEEGYESEEMEGEDRGRRRAPDVDPNGFGGPGYGTGNGLGPNHYGPRPDRWYSDAPPDATCPEDWDPD